MSVRPPDASDSAPGSSAGPLVQVTEFTGAACPWVWGSDPVFRLLRHGLRGQVRWRRVFGILFDEDDDAAPDRRDAAALVHHDGVFAVAQRLPAPSPE